MTDFARFYLIDGSREYTPTETDLLWLAKSLYGESTDQQGRIAAAWTMMQRFLRWPGGKWSTWKDMLRAFSQPINPIWADPESAKCLRYPESCTRERVLRRQKIQAWSWYEIPRDARAVALAFVQGALFNPVPQAVNFGAIKLVQNQGKTGITIGGNTFIDAQQDGMTWKDSLVRVEPSNDLPGGGVDPDVDYDFETEEETELVKKPFFRLAVFGGAIALFFALAKGKLK